MRALSFLLVLLGVTLSGCNGPHLALPPKGYNPTYLRMITPVHAYADAARVTLTIDNTEVDRTGHIIEHPETVRVLSATEKATFERTLQRVRLVGFPPRPDDSTGPACFVPHHFFRYYSAAGRQVGEIAVCFCCSGSDANPSSPDANARAGTFYVDIGEAKAFVRGLGLRTDMMCDPVDG